VIAIHDVSSKIGHIFQSEKWLRVDVSRKRLTRLPWKIQMVGNQTKQATRRTPLNADPPQIRIPAGVVIYKNFAGPFR
jgi:hypothetical protein